MVKNAKNQPKGSAGRRSAIIGENGPAPSTPGKLPPPPPKRAPEIPTPPPAPATPNRIQDPGKVFVRVVGQTIYTPDGPAIKDAKIWLDRQKAEALGPNYVEPSNP